MVGLCLICLICLTVGFLLGALIISVQDYLLIKKINEADDDDGRI